MGSNDKSCRETGAEKQELPTNSDGIVSPEQDRWSLTNPGEFCCQKSRELSGEPRSLTVGGEDADESIDEETKRSDGSTLGEDGYLMLWNTWNSRRGMAGTRESSVEGRINEARGVEGDSVSESIESPVDLRADAGSPSPDLTGIISKGKGLKKWRRRRRYAPKEGGPGLDMHRALKRGLSNVDPARNGHAQVGLIDISQKNEGSITSQIHLGFSSSLNYGAAFQIHNQDAFSATGNSLHTGEDEENSEDKVSRSSTVASVSRINHDMDVHSGHKVEDVGEETFAQSADFLAKQKNFNDGSKKSRTQKVNDFDGESDEEKLAIHLEGEGSSKMDERAILFANAESDASSVKIGGSPAGSLFSKHGSNCCDQCNGRWIQGQKNSCSCDYDGEANQFECSGADESVKGGEHTLDDTLTSRGQVNGVETEDELMGNGSFNILGSNSKINPQGHRKIENIEEVARSTKYINKNNSPHKEKDSWRESVAQLQAAEDALEKEIHKIRVIGQATKMLPDILGNSSGSISEHDHRKLRSENFEGNGFLSIDFLPTILHHRVIHLENKLKEADGVIKEKEQKLKELETFVSETNSQDHEIGNESGGQMKELETEIGSLFRDKIEVEVKYFILNETIKKLKYLVIDELPQLESDESLHAGQSQMLVKLKEAERHSLLLKSRAEELGTTCAVLSGTEEVLKMQNDVHKLSFFCFIQLIVLFIAILFSFSQLSHDFSEIAST